MSRPTGKPNGRPPIFKEETATAICERIASGESLRSICADPKMPALATVIKWLADPARERFTAQYARARETQADTLFDEVLAIADDVKNASSQDALRAAVLRVDARKWIAGKLRPKKYGDRVSHDVSVRVAANEMSDDELAKIASDRAALIEALPEDYPGRPPDD